jgi:uncharacterized protein YjiS (DUF1127 family)|tara:strand:- start:811 stop:1395 length:585 start_codon:yes stop_codon:yes gene_type:complete
MTVAFNKPSSSEMLAIQANAQRLQSDAIAKLIGKFAHAVSYLTGLGAVAAFIKRSFIYYKTLGELHDLDDRILRDIGVSVGEMEFTAVKASMAEAPKVPYFLGDALAYLVQARRRQSTRRQLMALDNHILSDIGLTRGDINAAVGSVQDDDLVRSDIAVTKPLDSLLVKPESDKLQAANCNPLPQADSAAEKAA